MFASQMLGGGLSALGASGVLGGVADGLVAAGSAQTDALALKSVSLHFFATVSSSTGAILPANMNPGEGMEIFNGGAQTLTLYPPSGGTINNIAANSGFSVATLKSCIVRCINPLKFFVMLGA